MLINFLGMPMDSLIIRFGLLTAPDSELILPTNLRQAILTAIAAHQSGNPLPETTVRSLIDPLRAAVLGAGYQESSSSDESDDYFDHKAAAAAGSVVSESESSDSEAEKN